MCEIKVLERTCEDDSFIFICMTERKNVRAFFMDHDGPMNERVVYHGII